MIIGTDTRTRVRDLGARPHAAICLIQARYDPPNDNIIGYGTGFLVGPHRIATAAHVIWNDLDGRVPAKRLPDAIDIFLGKGFLAGNPQLDWTLTSASYRDAVHPGHRSTGDGYDLARLNLPDNISAPLAVLGLARDMRPGDQATIGGFPAEAEPFGHYEGSGPIVTTDNALFRHQIDTTIGQSGAPVRVFRNGGWAVIGVHLAEADQAPNGAPTNKALALTPDRLAWLLAG